MVCMIPENPDISGIGVRVAIYAQNFLSFAPAFYALIDGKVDGREMDIIKDQSTTILVTAFAILISTIIQATTSYALSAYHASVILNLSWMNNTNTFIYFVLYVHHRSGFSGEARNQPEGYIPPEWSAWINHIRGGLRAIKTLFHPDLESHGVRALLTHSKIAEKQQEKEKCRNISKLVIALGSLHLTLMAAIGIWLWSSPTRFEAQQSGLIAASNGTVDPIQCTSVVLLGETVFLNSSWLRTLSLVIYSAFLAPVLNLVAPAVAFLALYMFLHRRFRSQYPAQPHSWWKAGTLPIVISLGILLCINVFFLVDTELTIHRVKNQQPGEAQWTFGQTLALLLLALPIRDTALLESYRRNARSVRYGEELRMAVERRDVHAIDVITHNQNVDVDVKVEGGQFVCALQLASFEGNEALVRRLLNRGAEVNKQGGIHASPFGAAYFQQRVPIMELLLERGAKPSCWQSSAHDISPLHFASSYGHERLVELLLKSGAYPDGTRQNGETPLHVAKTARIAQLLLLEYRANPEPVTMYNETPLHTAARGGHTDIVQVLLKRPSVNPDATTNNGDTALHIAARGGFEGVVALLLDFGADAHMARSDGETPLHTAARQGAQGIVSLLLSHSADSHTFGSDGDTPLHIAARGNFEPIVRLLIQTGQVDPNALNHIGETALHVALRNGAEAAAECLLELNANVNAIGADHESPIHIAVRTGSEDIVQMLIGAGATPYATDANGKTPGDIADTMGFVRIRQLCDSAMTRFSR